MQAIIYALDIKNKPKRHTEIYHGEKSNPIHKYSQSVITVVKSLFEKHGKDIFINDCVAKYKANLATKPKRKGEKIMSSFHESQLEQAFVELFQKRVTTMCMENAFCVIHETLFSTMICAFICGKI